MSDVREHIECSDDDCNYFTDQAEGLPLGKCPYCGSQMIYDVDFLDSDGTEIEFEMDWGDDDDYACEAVFLGQFDDDEDEYEDEDA